MNATMNRAVFLAAMVAVTIVLWNAPVYAQRNAGAKFRGEFGTGFWNVQRSASTFSLSPSRSYRSYSYEPQVESRRSFSYEPGLSTGSESMLDQSGVYSFSPSNRGYGEYRTPLKAPWMYPKSDPRRYTSSRR